MMDQDRELFVEEQRFTQPWLRVLMLVSLLPVLLVFAHGLYQQIFLGQPWGHRPMSDPGLIISSTLVLLITAGLFALLYWAKLTTRVDAQGLHLKFVPFHRVPRTIDLSDLEEVIARQYAPLREFGGWGIRGGRDKRAYNVRGDRGVQLTFRGGRILLIGSQRSAELEQAILKLWAGS